MKELFLKDLSDIVEKMQWQYDNDIANINDKKYHLVDKDLLKYIRYLEQENQALKDQIETMQINWKPAPIKNSETIVKTCKCGEKHYFTNCYNEVYDRQKELIELIEKNEQPNKIRVAALTWEWKKHDYICGEFNLMKQNTLYWLSNVEIYIPTEPLLTDEEKAYLKAVIEPFKDEVSYIEISTNGREPDYESSWLSVFVRGAEDYSIIDIVLKDETFLGLEFYKEYSLKDLDLE